MLHHRANRHDNVSTIKVHNGDDCSLLFLVAIHLGLGRKMVAKRIFHSYQLSGFTCFAFLSKLNRRLGDFHFCAIFSLLAPFRASIKKHFIFLKDKTRDFPLQEKWKNGSRETFSVVFIDFSSDSLSFFSGLAQSICLISASLLCRCSLPKKFYFLSQCIFMYSLLKGAAFFFTFAKRIKTFIIFHIVSSLAVSSWSCCEPSLSSFTRHISR